MNNRKFHAKKRSIIVGICLSLATLFSGCGRAETALPGGMATDMASSEGNMTVNGVPSDGDLPSDGTLLPGDTLSQDGDSLSDSVLPSDAVSPDGTLSGNKQQNNGTADNSLPKNVTTDSAQEYTIIMVGDVLLHTLVEESCRQPDGSYDYDSLFANTKAEISAADLALVNQEVIIGGRILALPDTQVSMQISACAILW